ncbi:xin actin-binding repeat-containing protein 2 [Trichomycterus rosablanca]|uniref:xin actin-binding repeat-containing protein 2 n=1 Tax=Trichomycterus rosablanca TaxID=2290929 RepID=UPI002F35128E
MATYQFADTKQDLPDFSRGVMEETEVCSVPGGVASIRKQFEKNETSSSNTVTQFNSTHRPVQVSHQEMDSTAENHYGEDEEYYPKLSAKELARQFEKTIEEAAPYKKIKTEHYNHHSQQTSHVNVSDQTFNGELPGLSKDTVDSATAEAEDLEFIDDISDDFLDDLPPPPPDLLEDLPEDPDFPEPTEPTNFKKQFLTKDQHLKQKELLELKRLCKHFHPDVRKDLERDFYNEVDYTDHEELVGEVQNATYQFEHSENSTTKSLEAEYLEWDEILRGEVQSMCWMFENKPLDCIKNSSDEDEGSKMRSYEELLAGGDVKNTALLFETQPIDTLRQGSAKKDPYNKISKKDVRAAAWLFESQPMDSLHKMYDDTEQSKEVVFTQEAARGNLRCMQHVFENQQIDSLGDTETMDENHLLSLKSVIEEIKDDVKVTVWMFETQCMCVLREHSGQVVEITSIRREETEKGGVKTSRWLFETQPLDIINKDPSEVRLISSVSLEDSPQDDLKRGRWLFETKNLSSSKEEWQTILMQQKEVIIRADVRKQCTMFETQPMDKLKDDSNSRPITTEIIGGDVRSVRHLFETPALNTIKELPEVGKLKKKLPPEEKMWDLRHQNWVLEKQPSDSIHNEEEEPVKLNKIVASDEERGDVRHQKWQFENQKLEDIQEEKKEVIKLINTEQTNEECYKGDVKKSCWVFETQSMDTLKDHSNDIPVNNEEMIKGDVQSARQFFETPPQDELRELGEVGKLKKRITNEEETGDVRHQKWVFESQPLEQIRDEKKEISRTVIVDENEKVDVANYKQIFETYDLSRYNENQKIQVEGVTVGSVKSNKDLFESTPMYAMQDSLGHYHEVKTVLREEIVKGNVKSCKWMFETRPIDQMDESVSRLQVIKGITQQEVESGDVKTAKWLFETQPLDSIKYFSNIEDEECVIKEATEIVKGNVKTCKWLFETKPMDVLYEKVELKSENESNEVQKGNVKTCTWLFETQALDTIRDESENVLQTCTVKQEDIQGKDVRMARFLFETENIENITGEDGCTIKQVTEIDIQSGDVSRMKYRFDTQSADVMTSTSEEFMHQLRTAQAEDIQKGNVGNCKWRFENQPIDAIHEDPNELKEIRTLTDVQGGDVDKGRLIFETYSLDKIQEVSADSETKNLQKVVFEDDEKGDVKNYAMMFETQPLYAIQDKEGHYHEVTTLTKEEILKGDVVGARWLFETKPIDSIRDDDEVYVIKSVTEEDIQKGDVTSARWKFETQPLDKITDDKEIVVKTVEDIKGGDVKANKLHFESELPSQKLVRTVSMTEIHKGDVRAARWMFETSTIDQIHNKNLEDKMETVVLQEHVKGDVKESVWLFEKNPLDSIKENKESKPLIREEIPKGDVKTTTWLFETTPFPAFNESNVVKTEIIGKNIKETLDELYSHKMVESKGIILETDEIGDVRMAKYNLMNKEAPQIQKEEIIKGDLQNIMMNLLYRQETNEKSIVIDEHEKGNIVNTVQQLFNQKTDTNVEKEEIIRGDIQEAVNNLLKEENTGKRGILIQEDEKGDVCMTIYSLFNKHNDALIEKEEVVKGDIKSCLEKLNNPDTEQFVKIQVDETEKGQVNFYSTCIESGSLDYLKQLQQEPDETETSKQEKEEIVGGDIEGTKLSLMHNQAKICRLVNTEEIVPGDVHNTVKVFLTEPPVSFENLQKEEIVGGDLRATLNSLTQCINQPDILEKEEIIKGDISTALKSLQEAQNQPKEVEKPEIIPGNIKGALKSLEDSVATKVEILTEDVVPGDIKGALQSLEEAKQTVRVVEKDEIVKGDVNSALQSLQEASTDRKICQQEIEVQGDVKGTIQLLLEPPPSSPRMQRRASTEGDVKHSIKSLYETQEHEQSEKEEVIKGDVKGTIKCLLETAQRASPKIPRREPIRKVKTPKVKVQSPTQQEVQSQKSATAVKKVTNNSESQKNVQELVSTKTMQEKKTHVTKKKANTQASKTTTVEHKTIYQTHEVKTIKTEFRNLKGGRKGLIRLDKTKDKKQEVDLPPPPSMPVLPEPDFPLPPSPSPDFESLPFPLPPPVTRADNDLPPPPSPPPPLSEPEKSSIDHLPPPPTPPPPPAMEQEFLPPPPSQQELDLIPIITPVKPTKLTVKPVKAPALCKVPKLKPVIQLNNTDIKAQTDSQGPINTEILTNISSTQSQSISSVSSSLISSEIQSSIITEPPGSPYQTKKIVVYMGLTPPASPPPPSQSAISKGKNALIKSDQKSKEEKKEIQAPPSSPGFEIHKHELISPALLSFSLECTSSAQSEESASDITQIKTKKKTTKVTSHTESSNSSKTDTLSDVPESKTLISTKNRKSPVDISSDKQHIITNQTPSIQQQATPTTSKKKKKYRSMTTNIQQITSTSVTESEIIISKGEQASTSVPITGTKDHPAIFTSESLSSEIKADNEEIINTQLTDKSENEKGKKTFVFAAKGHGKASPDQVNQTKINTDSKAMEAEQKVQKTKKGRKKDEGTEKMAEDKSQSVTLTEESARVKDLTERKVTVTENKAEKQVTQKQAEEGPVLSKKKRRAKPKKDKEITQQTQSNTTVPQPALSLEDKHSVSTPNQKQEEIKVVQTQKTIQGENSEFHKEITFTESKVQQHLQQQAITVKSQKQTKTSQKKKEQVDSQKITGKPEDESRNVTEELTRQGPLKTITESMTALEKCATAQKLLSHVTELQETTGKIDSKSVKTLLNEIPEWLIGPEDKNSLVILEDENNTQKLKEIVAHVHNLVQEKLMDVESNIAAIEKHECEATSEKSDLGRATQRIARITIDSKKVETQKKEVDEKKGAHESQKLEEKNNKSLDIRSRSSSPTFITIESTRRTDSPQRVAPSPPPMPPTPPPRRSETPTSRLTRASPSPTRGRADSLTRLREVTARLSRGPSPDPGPHPVPVTGKKSEIVEIPATFHRQIKSDSMAVEEAIIREKYKDSSEDVDKTAVSIKTQEIELNKTFAQKDLSKCLGIQTKECLKMPAKEGQLEANWSAENKINTSKESTYNTKQPGQETKRPELEKEKATKQEDIPDFNISVVKNTFETDEQSSSIKGRKNKQEEQASRVKEITSESSKHEPQHTFPQSSQQTSPLPLRKETTLEKSVDPPGFSQTQTITEHYSAVHDSGTRITETRSSTTISKHSENVVSQSVPISYADAVKKKAPEAKVSPEASAEELMKKFHKMWTDSETVFKSLGCSVSDQSSQVGAVHSVSEESVPHGESDSRQKDVP